MEEVDYLGFRITTSGIKPREDFLQSIRNFPTPRNITDVRSWYGMINQISYAFAIAPVMLPFRHLLSSKLPFHWSPEFQSSFDSSKEEIIRQCEKGVRTFSLTAPTALATDWSKQAMGFWLTQKFCQCTGPVRPGCCKTGWQTVYCDSRFCSPAESRYHPIEGEACALKNGLEKCKVFLLGHPNLIVCVDHKPLLATMGDQELVDIPNPRLLDFKIKSMAYQFTPRYIPGKDHVTPDAFSRRSDAPIASAPISKPAKFQMPNNVLPAYSETFGPPVWVSPPSFSATSAPVLTSSPNTEEISESNRLEELMMGIVLADITAITNNTDVEAITWE